MANYTKVWLDTLTARVAGKTLKRRTLESYENTLTLHILPALGTLRVRNITMARIKPSLLRSSTTGIPRRSET